MKKTKLFTGLFAVALLGGSLAACDQLQTIIIPPSVKEIDFAFKDCSQTLDKTLYYCGSANLENVHLSDNIQWTIFVTSKYQYKKLGGFDVNKDEEKCQPYGIYKRTTLKCIKRKIKLFFLLLCFFFSKLGHISHESFFVTKS